MFLSSKNFVESTAMLLRTKSYVDAKVILDDGTVHKIHKLLLARDSLFFHKLFTHKQGIEYRLEMVEREEFARVLDWIYEVNWNHRYSVATVFLYSRADIYQITDQSASRVFNWKEPIKTLTVVSGESHVKYKACYWHV